MQAATRAWSAACERYSKSTEKSRVDAAAENYVSQLAEICGPQGDGAGGKFGVAFPVKKRRVDPFAETCSHLLADHFFIRFFLPYVFAI